MLKIAVIGAGRIGRIHAHNIAAHAGATVAGIVDPDTAAAERLAAECAAPVISLDQAFAAEAVLIGSPTPTHADYIERAAAAGQAVFCEKPIHLSAERVRTCLETVRRAGIPLMIGFNRRFDPSFKAVRDRMAAGEIGKPELVLISSRDPGPPPIAYVKVSGGLFRDMTIHDFDMARYLVGDIVEVQAFGGNLVDPAIRDAGDIDTAMVTMRAANGAMVHINNSRRCAYGYDQRIEAFGEHGMLQAGNRMATTVEASGGKQTGAKDVVLNFFIQRYQEAYAAEVEHFVACVREKAPPIAGFAEGLEALRLADAALESLRTGQIVRVHKG